MAWLKAPPSWRHLVLLILAPMTGQAQTREGYLDRPAGVRLYYRVEGHGPDTLVYLHGGPGGILSEREIQANAPLFPHHTVIFYQQRGTGKSSAVDEDSLLTAPQHVDDLDALRQAFRLQRLILIGHSWGGGLAALYATTHPDRVARLIQVNPMPPRLNGIGSEVLRVRLTAEEQAQWGEAEARYREHPDSATCLAFQRLNVIIATVPGPNREAMIAEACHDPHQPTAEEAAAEHRTRVVSRIALGSIRREEFMAALRTVPAPALLIRGDADFIPLAGLLDYARSYPDARYLTIPNAGHDLPSENPTPLFQAIELFLQGIWPAEAVVAH